MLSFNKGFNKQNNIDTNKYSKFGRLSPQEIIEKRYKENINNLNKKNDDLNQINIGYQSRFKTPIKESHYSDAKSIKQVNNEIDTYNKLNAFKNIK